MIVSETIPSKLEIIPEFISSLLEKIKVLPISEDEIFSIRLSLEEALINAIKYGNKLNQQLWVEINVEFKDKELIIKVKDQGEGFDFKNLPDPTKKDNLKKTFGRGIFLIKKLMDKVEFFDFGRGIKMTKFLKQESPDEDKRRNN